MGWMVYGNGKNPPKEDGFYQVSLSEKVVGTDDGLAVTKDWYCKAAGRFTNYGAFVDAWQPLPERYRPEGTV